MEGKKKICIVNHGRTAYSIVIAKDASPSTQYGAQELQRFLREMTGVNLAILKEPSELPEHAIILGDSPSLHQVLSLQPGLPTTKELLQGLGSEGYVLRSVGPYLIIAGGALRGNLYGVYGLLEDHLGCRWFTPEVSRIPHYDVLIVPQINERKVPVLEYREPFVMDCFDGDWCARNRVNSSAASLEEKHGGKVRFGNGMFVHTFNRLVPPEKYFDKHPEYFSEINGKRVREHTQLCCTNEDVIQICIEQVRKAIQQDPGAFVYSVSQNDWGNYCQCPRCAALAEQEGSQMGPVLYLVNRVAAAIEKEYPDKAIETLAYQFTRKPPKHMRPRPNVIIRLCSIECDFMQPFATSDARANQEFVRDLQGWSKVANRLWVWNYVTSFHSYLCPFPNLHVRKPNIQLLEANNVKGIFEQDVYNTLNGELSPLSGYLNAKLLWDPDYDDDVAINEFLRGVYGKAAPYIRQYIELLENKVKRDNIHEGIWTGPDTAPYLTDAILEKSDQLWDKAEKAVAKEPDVLERVQIARLSEDYAVIERQRGAGGLGQHVIDHKDFRVTTNPAYIKRVRHFFDVAHRAHVTRMDEGRLSLEQYESLFADSLKSQVRVLTPQNPVKPGVLAPGLSYAYFKGGNWNDIPDFSLLEFSKKGIVDHFCLEPHADESDTAYGLRFEGVIDVPSDGIYTFYLLSNDGSRLYIGSRQVVDNGGLHAKELRGGYVALKAGMHPVRVDYFQAGGGEALQVYWEGPGFKKEEIPAKVLHHIP